MAIDNDKTTEINSQMGEMENQVLQDEYTAGSTTGTTPEDVITEEPPKKKRFSLKLILIIVGVVFTLLLLLLVFVRYGDNAVGPVSGDGRIEWWIVKEDADTLRPLVDDFERENPNIDVILRPQSERDYQARLTNALNSNNSPDIFEIHRSWLPMFSEHLYPLPSSVMSQNEFANSFYPIISADVISDQGIVAIPIFYDAITLYINQDIFTTAARTPPTTWIEFEELAHELTQRNRDIIIQAGAALGNTENVDYWPEILGLMMYQNGASLSRPSGRAVLNAFEFYNSFAQEEVWDSRLPSSTDLFAQGQLAMYFGPASEAHKIINANPSLRFRTIPLPQLPKQRPDEPDVSYTTYFVQGVNNNSGDRNDSWRLLKFISERESLIRVNDLREERGMYSKPYPRMDMANLQNDDPILGSVISLASEARSWYLADDRIESANTLNDQINAVYSKYLNVSGLDEEGLQELTTEISTTLSKFGIRSQ